ncbi:MAG: FliM/FliN family flagellar motor switch protein [Planctomycetes bacterium]|nr:FliM/FliN family flagellar motor switch protein [Planctomycetota bacterium]
MKRTPPLKAVTDIEVEVSVELAETSLSLQEILDLRPGASISFADRPDRFLLLEVDGVPVGKGRAVERAGRLGIRLEAMLDPASPPARRGSASEN